MRRRGRKGSCHRNGFTLIEIMLVMVIIGILAGAISANLSAAYRSMALEADADLLADTIADAQRTARARRVICRLSIDLEDKSYALSTAATLEGPFKELQDRDNPVSLDRAVSFGDVRKLERGGGRATEINFYPDGRSEPATVVLQSQDGEEERTIEVGALATKPIQKTGEQ